MKVLVDCTQITRRKAGVGVYALNLVKGLKELQDRDFDLWLLVQSDDHDFVFKKDDTRIISIPSRFFRLFLLRLLMEQFYIPWLLWKYEIDILHSLHYSFPLIRTRARKIVTLHDMTSFIMPEVHLPVKIAYFHFFIRAASRFADALIFVSSSTQADWKRYFPKSSKLSFVIPLGKEPLYRSGIDPFGVERVMQKYHIARPYILYIGTIEPRKNLVRLVHAFANISRQFSSHSLVIAGMKGWGYDKVFDAVKHFNLNARVIFTGFIDEVDKPQLLTGADVFVYVSLYEGFGIPVLEALACGAPTLTSNVSSLPEVAGDAALFVNPENTDEIAKRLADLLDNPDLRRIFHDKALIQSANYTWERTVCETLRAYCALID
jgi:glycosyltransferase involved in cell wall biosynthesis